MSNKQPSKFRHIFAKSRSNEKTTDLNVGVASQECNLIKNTRKYFAFPWKSEFSGVTLGVWPRNKPGRIGINIDENSKTNLIYGHKGKLTDFDFSPFRDNLLFTGSEDGTVKLWKLPNDEKKTIMYTEEEFSGDFEGHNKKILSVNFHTIADNILVTTGGDNLIKLWDIEKCKEKLSVECGNSPALNVSWNYDGSCFVSSSTDKTLKVIDPRSNKIEQEVTTENQGSKGFRALWMGDKDKIITTGVNKMSQRIIQVWDIKDIKKPLATQIVDNSGSTILSFYDPAISVLYFTGRGDAFIKLYLITESEPFIEELCVHNNFQPISGLNPLHKTELDVRKHNIMSFMKLEKKIVEPVDFFVPRKSEYFQDDLFPLTQSYDTPSLTQEDWFEGKTEKPYLISLQPEDMTAESMAEKKEKLKPKYSFKEEQQRIDKEKELSKGGGYKILDTVNSYDFDEDEKEKELPEDW